MFQQTWRGRDCFACFGGHHKPIDKGSCSCSSDRSWLLDDLTISEIPWSLLVSRGVYVNLWKTSLVAVGIVFFYVVPNSTDPYRSCFWKLHADVVSMILSQLIEDSPRFLVGSHGSCPAAPRSKHEAGFEAPGIFVELLLQSHSVPVPRNGIWYDECG